MSRNNADGRQGGPLNPQALSPADAARVLTALGNKPVTLETLHADVGAPTNPDGTIDLVAYAAWLVKEMGRGD